MGRLLILDRIEIEGFRCFTRPQDLRFGGRGAVAVVGPNGAGKSTATALALTWALFGKGPPQRMGSGARALTGKSVISRGGDRARVAVTLRSESQAWKIERVRPRKGSEVVTVTTSSGSEVGQAAVDAVIAVSYEVFTRTVVRGQGDPWSFAEATDSRKREILDAVSGAERLSSGLERARGLRARHEAQAQGYASRAADCRRRLQATNLDSAREAAMAWEAGRAERLRVARQEVDALAMALSDAERLEAGASELHARRRALQAQRPISNLGGLLQAARAAEEAAKGAYARWYGAAQDAHRYIAMTPGAGCPTCGQAIGHAAPVLELRRRADDLAASTLARSEQARIAAAQAAEAFERAADQHRAEEQRWVQAVSQVPEAPQVNAAAQRAALEYAIRHASEIETATNPHAIAFDQAHGVVRGLQAELACLEELEGLEREDAAVFEAWEAVLSPKGVRAHLADSVLSAITSEANRWLELLSAGRLTISFQPTRETGKGDVREEITTLVSMRQGDHVDTAELLEFSGGERARINFAVDLGLAAVFSKGGGLALSFLVLDEQSFSFLDEAGKAAMVQAVLAAGVSDVVVVDHDPRLAAMMPRRIVVRHSSEGSQVDREEE